MERMDDLLANRSALGSDRAAIERGCLACVVLLVALALVASGCHRILPVDTTPLDSAGMNYDSIQKLKKLKITSQEVTELAKARLGGFPDTPCVEAIQIFHSRGQAFAAGDAIAELAQVSMGEDTILELARLNQLGLGSGELQAMRLAGLSDETILEVARHHAEGKPVLSGASLAGMKNTGLLESTLLELARHGVPDSQADAIISLRRHGANDATIVRRFASS
jgi:hypothetical protein